MKEIKVLDCTLRDGGCVNDFNFGEYYMQKILHGLENADVEYIELGYIDQENGSQEERTKYSDDIAIKKSILNKKQEGKKYLAMIDYGRFDPRKLADRTNDSIDGIRLAFHKKDRYEILDWGKIILDKGYELFIQPMLSMRYSDEELLEFIKLVNERLPKATAFYIVDSFGEMRLYDVRRIASIINHNLNESIAMGFHSHNNLELSYSNAVDLLSFPTNRDLIFDSTIMGMGKGAGNMKTEIFMEHLNLYNNKNYNIKPLLEVIDSVINQLKQDYDWGYSVEYFLSASNSCSPSYANHFYNKHMLSIESVSYLLSMIEEEKKISFDKKYADELYYKYNSKDIDDSEAYKILKSKIGTREVMLVAPGKSVVNELDRILDYMNRHEVFTIALNNEAPFECDYYFISKSHLFEYITRDNILVTSSVGDIEKGLLFNYSEITKGNEETKELALNMILNILERCGVKNISLVGFDGFTSDIDSNYFDPRLKRPFSKEKADVTNSTILSLLGNAKEKFKITFVTRSMYEDAVN